MPAAPRTTAVRDGDDWILNGTKIFITNAGEAEIYVVLRPDRQGCPETSRHQRLHRRKRNAGIFLRQEGKEDGHPLLADHGTGLRELPDSRPTTCWARKAQGFKVAMKTLDGGRIGIASQALGIAQGALDAAVAYAKERKQFDTPIASVSGRAVPARRHGHPDRGGTAADLQGRLSRQRRSVLFPASRPWPNCSPARRP